MPAPFVVGQWVRAEKFYGRQGLIDEILDGNRDWLWLLGTRRIGKTSLLKQIEHLTSGPESQYFPLFWDFQGADSPDELHMGFSDSLLDAEPRLEKIGIEPADVEADSVFPSLNRLRRKLRSKNFKLLLLCDEVEELIKLNEKDPAILRKLRRALQSQEDIRSVLASTIRLWALADQRGDTSPFLHGFSPPLYIHNLSDEEARDLIRQANLPTDSRPRFDDETVEAIRSHCDNHPYLIQLLCKRCTEMGSFEDAVAQVAADPMVSFFFSVDFDMLTEEEHEIIRAVASHESSTSNSIQRELPMESAQLEGSLHRLEHLGFVRRDADRRFVLVNYFFRRWLNDRPSLSLPSRGATQTPTLQLPADRATSVGSNPSDVFDGRYELIDEVGKGATGIVWKAFDRMLRTHIAIKLLKKELSANEDMLERFRREIILSMDLTHPNIVKIYHLGDYNGKKYLTMKYIEGETLSKAIRREGPFEEERMIFVSARLADALAAAHSNRVLHRDIKPQNILVDKTGEPYLTDFGLARLVGDPGMTRHGVFVGTPDYASPEQAEFKPLDERSDIYSLGLILFELATGRRPFKAASTNEVLEMHRNATPPDPLDLRPALRPELARIIRRCMQKDRDERYQSAAVLLRELSVLG
ncbi:MAG: protein kinase [bacterium]|nr:protein kinase [bacterium]